MTGEKVDFGALNKMSMLEGEVIHEILSERKARKSHEMEKQKTNAEFNKMRQSW